MKFKPPHILWSRSLSSVFKKDNRHPVLPVCQSVRGGTVLLHRVCTVCSVTASGSAWHTSLLWFNLHPTRQRRATVVSAKVYYYPPRTTLSEMLSYRVQTWENSVGPSKAGGCQTNSISCIRFANQGNVFQGEEVKS